MRTAVELWQRVGFEDAPRVDQLLLRGAAVGAVGAAFGTLVTTVTSARPPGGLPVAFAAALALVALPRHGFGLRLALAFAVSVLALLLPWSPSSLPYFFTVALGVSLALEPLPAWRRGLALVGPSLGAAWCLWVVRWLSAWHLGPFAAARWLPIAAAGLFVAAGASLAWVSFAGDAVEPRLLVTPKVLHTWLRLRSALRRIPQGAHRARLQALAEAGAARFLAARAEADALQRSLDAQLEAETASAVVALQERLAQDTDAQLRAHLQQLLRVHQDTLEQLEGLRRQLERLDARAAAEAAWLDTAAFSLERAPAADPLLADVVSRLGALATARGGATA